MNTSKPNKIFVLDTNVILHDHRCIYQFQDNDIIIPITVLEELDKFKKGNEPINFHAREFVRMLDKFSADGLFGSGYQLGDGLGKLNICIGFAFSDKMKLAFKEDIPDHRILAVADHYSKKEVNHPVVLVSKDVNLRMKAKSLGLMAEDYKNDSIKDPHLFEHTITTLEGLSADLLDRVYKTHETEPKDAGIEKEPYPNQSFILQSNANATALVRYNRLSKKLRLVDKQHAYGIRPRNAEQTFSFDSLLDPEIKLVSLSGKAGTGKTLLALAAALEQHREYDQILLARPIVALSNRDLGFLPGDAKEKISPYMQPLFDNLTVIKNALKPQSQEAKAIDEMLEKERLVISPLAYIRGRSLSKTFVIVDEAQNLTPHEIKTVITRAGEGTKMVFTGDFQQIDTPYLDGKSNGLAYMTERMKKQDVFAHINLTKGERSFLSELASDLL